MRLALTHVALSLTLVCGACGDIAWNRDTWLEPHGRGWGSGQPTIACDAFGRCWRLGRAEYYGRADRWPGFSHRHKERPEPRQPAWGGSATRPRDGRVSRTTARTFATASASAGAIAEARFPHSSTPCQQFSPARALMVLSSAGARGRGLDLGAAAIERVPSGGADSCIRAGCYPDPNSARRKPAMCLAHRLR